MNCIAKQTDIKGCMRILGSLVCLNGFVLHCMYVYSMLGLKYKGELSDSEHGMVVVARRAISQKLLIY